MSGPPILPTKNLPLGSSVVLGFTKRYARIGLIAMVSLSAFTFFKGFEKTREIFNSFSHPPLKNPPLYEKYHEYEDKLPQHNLNLPYPEGRDAKFFWVGNHITRAHSILLT
jgi:hypothetical protein